ncbi:hypothetical protein BP5796_10743 [Coleophoma crateriformis]|uniref:ABM domain-containing protein n=1 Tax=Coleophoma crateriformis TaxID=565419 RepID=A0A3D8QRA6_9HELO|nr:hypothetical protein BP5796_10743 [Coleophoma crateriformis]
MFAIYGNVQFVPGGYDDWQAAYDKLDEYVWANEPTTKTYYFGIPLENEDRFSKTDQMLAFEIYGKREDLYETHFSSPAMSTFLQKIPSTMSCGLDLTHYTQTSGFLDKSQSAVECQVIHDTKIACASSQARAVVLERLASIAAREEKQKGTYTFVVLKSLDTETEVRIFERYESFEALEAHKSSKEVVEFWLGSKEQIKSMEGRAYVPNNKGWLTRDRHLGQSESHL